MAEGSDRLSFLFDVAVATAEYDVGLTPDERLAKRQRVEETLKQAERDQALHRHLGVVKEGTQEASSMAARGPTAASNSVALRVVPEMGARDMQVQHRALPSPRNSVGAQSAARGTTYSAGVSQQPVVRSHPVSKPSQLSYVGSPTGDNQRQTRSTPFPRRLFDMIEAESAIGSKILTWSRDGSAFFVNDESIFVNETLPKYNFRASKLASFQRNLNIYGFQRIVKGELAGAYVHPLFYRDMPVEELHKILRRDPTYKSRSAVTRRGSDDNDSDSPISLSRSTSLDKGFADIQAGSPRGGMHADRGMPRAHLSYSTSDSEVSRTSAGLNAKIPRPNGAFYPSSVSTAVGPRYLSQGPSSESRLAIEASTGTTELQKMNPVHHRPDGQVRGPATHASHPEAAPFTSSPTDLPGSMRHFDKRLAGGQSGKVPVPLTHDSTGSTTAAKVGGDTGATGPAVSQLRGTGALRTERVSEMVRSHVPTLSQHPEPPPSAMAPSTQTTGQGAKLHTTVPNSDPAQALITLLKNKSNELGAVQGIPLNGTIFGNPRRPSGAPSANAATLQPPKPPTVQAAPSGSGASAQGRAPPAPSSSRALHTGSEMKDHEQTTPRTVAVDFQDAIPQNKDSRQAVQKAASSHVPTQQEQNAQQST